MEPITVRPAGSPRRTISRHDDRRITFGGLVLAASLLAGSIVSVALPEATRHGIWLPLHLALAGAAATAVAAVLPFFTAALAVAPPAGRPARIVAIGGIAGGALAVSGGVAAGVTVVAVGGGLAYLSGLAALAVAAFAPLRASLGPRRALVIRAYAGALTCVAVGAALATAYLAGLPIVIERWGQLKPAHAWLNVVGFLSVIVAATLVHLAPTVVGARIRPRTSAPIAVGGTLAGAATVATGLALAIDAVVRLGAVLAVVGAVGLVAHAAVVQRDRGTWTTDPGWHRLTSWSLLLAPAWFAVGMAMAGGRLLVSGADPAAWDVLPLAPALAVGWIAQVLVGSWTHLLPAIGPGDPISHARQRALLGRLATARLLALDVGVAVATIGLLAGPAGDLAAALGIALMGAALSLALGLAAAAAVTLRGRPSRAEPARTPANR